MNNYLFQFIIFLFVYFTQIQCNSTEPYVSFESTMDTSAMVPNATSSSSSASTVISSETMVPNATSPSSSASTVISTVTSNEPDGTNSLSVTSSKTMNSSTYASSMGTNALTEHFTSQFMLPDYSTMTSESISNILIGFIIKILSFSRHKC